MLRGFPIPFGVFLGSTAIVAFFFGNQFLRWYWRML
jgi:prepilin signal peptidase PulO-like enzyme (type II secretory pathway)